MGEIHARGRISLRVRGCNKVIWGVVRAVTSGVGTIGTFITKDGIVPLNTQAQILISDGAKKSLCDIGEWLFEGSDKMRGDGCMVYDIRRVE